MIFIWNSLNLFNYHKHLLEYQFNILNKAYNLIGTQFMSSMTS